MIPDRAASEASPGLSIDTLLTRRLRRTDLPPVLARRRGRIVLDAVDSGLWTLSLGSGAVSARRGALPDADLTVRGGARELAGILAGHESGVTAFLDGRVTVRGDLSLSLQLDGLFGDGPHGSGRQRTGDVPRAHQHPRAEQVLAMGVRTSYLEAGPTGAPPVLLLHGLGATNASMLPVLADLAADHRVLAPDLPGFGDTDAPAVPYNAAWFAAWVDAFQRATASRPAVVVGNSLGGRIALECGLAHPRSVRALVLLTPSPAFRRLRQYIPAVRLVSPQVARLPLRASHRMAVEGIRVMFADPARLPQAWYDAAADEVLRVLADRAHRVAFFACARQIYLEDAYGRDGFWQRLPGLHPPALFIWGNRDRLVPASFARHVADALPGADSVVVEDCGHVPHFEHPETTRVLVRRFLERH